MIPPEPFNELIRAAGHDEKTCFLPMAEANEELSPAVYHLAFHIEELRKKLEKLSA